MANAGKKQGVISGSMMFKGKEYVEIFDHQHKYLYGEVDDLFIAYGAWVEYNVVEAPADHPRNCYQMAVNIDQEVKQSKAPTTDQFGKQLMNVREFNKVDFFQYVPEGGQLTHKSAIQRDFTTDNYYNTYYGEVSMAKDSRKRLIEHQINTLDVMLNLISSDRYQGHGPHWEVTHFINQGKQYSINGYLSIRGFVLRGPGGVVRNRRDVVIPPDALRPINYNGAPQSRRRATPPVASADSWDEEIQTPQAPQSGLGSFGGSGFGAKSFAQEEGSQKPEGFGAINVSMETVKERPERPAQTRSFGFRRPTQTPAPSSNSDDARGGGGFSGFANAGFATSFGKTDTTSFRGHQEVPAPKITPMNTTATREVPRSFGFSSAPARDKNGASGESSEPPRAAEASIGAFGSSAASSGAQRSFGGASGAVGRFGTNGDASGTGVGAFGPRFGASEASRTSSGSFGESTGSGPGFGANASFGTSSPAPRSFGGTKPSGTTSGATSGAGFEAFGQSEEAISSGPGFGRPPASFGGTKSSGATSGAGFGAFGQSEGSQGSGPGFGASEPSSRVPRSFGSPATPSAGIGSFGAGVAASEASSKAPRSFGGATSGGPRSFGGGTASSGASGTTSGAPASFGASPGTAAPIEAGNGASGATRVIPRSFGGPATLAPGLGGSSTIPRSFGGPASTADRSNRSIALNNTTVDIETPRLANMTLDTSHHQHQERIGSFGAGVAASETSGGNNGASGATRVIPRSFGGSATLGPGFGASSTIPRSFGGPGSTPAVRSKELTSGNRVSVLNNTTIDIETPQLANRTQDTTRQQYQEVNNNKPTDLFNDSWGDDTEDIERPMMSPPPPRSGGFGLPPIAKGLAKFNGNRRF